MNGFVSIDAIDPDGDKLRVGIDWNRDGNVDEWSFYEFGAIRFSFNASGQSGKANVIAEDIHGARSEWSGVNSAILRIWFINSLKRFEILKLINNFFSFLF